MNRLILIKIVFMLFLFFSGYDNTNACTAFCFIQDGESVLLCKNLDWSIGHGFVVINRRVIKKSAFVDAVRMIGSRSAPYENLRLTAGPLYEEESTKKG